MKKLLLALMAFTMAFAMLGGAACLNGGSSESESGSSGPEEEGSYTAPVITIANTTLEMYPSDALDYEDNWMFDVTVTDEYDAAEDVDVQINWGGFDQSAPVAGTYTITYTATNSKGESASATRTLTIKDSLPQIVLEVQKHQNSNGPETTTLAFEGQYYMELSADTADLAAKSYVIKNTASTSITVSVAGKYGCVAIVDANGIVVEGRDGANAKLVNADNPLRASGAALDATAFAANMQIPAGGFAIVVQAYYAGDNANNDGRNFLNYNAIYQYGTPVHLYSTDTTVGALTTYVDQGPVVKSAANVSVYVGTTLDEAKAQAIAGIAYSDDNGTFGISDDITSGLTITVINDGGYNATVTGAYTFTLEIADANGKKTEFTRVVNVNQDLFEVGYTYTNGTYKSYSVDENSNVCVVNATTACPTQVGNYEFIIFTSDYTGTLKFDNGYGVAVILDKYGCLKAVYDGANAKLYTSATFDERTSLSSADYDTLAFAAWSADLTDGEYLIFAPNGVNGNASRGFLNGCRWFDSAVTSNTVVQIGIQFKLTGTNKTITFATKPSTQA